MVEHGQMRGSNSRLRILEIQTKPKEHKGDCQDAVVSLINLIRPNPGFMPLPGMANGAAAKTQLRNSCHNPHTRAKTEDD